MSESTHNTVSALSLLPITPSYAHQHIYEAIWFYLSWNNKLLGSHSGRQSFLVYISSPKEGGKIFHG